MGKKSTAAGANSKAAAKATKKAKASQKVERKEKKKTSKNRPSVDSEDDDEDLDPTYVSNDDDDRSIDWDRDMRQPEAEQVKDMEEFQDEMVSADEEDFPVSERAADLEDLVDHRASRLQGWSPIYQLETKESDAALALIHNLLAEIHDQYGTENQWC